MAKQTKPTTVLDTIRGTSQKYAALLERQQQLIDRADEIKREVGGNTTTWRSTLDAGGTMKSQSFEESLGAQFVRNRTWEDDTPRPDPKPALVRRAVVAANELLDGLLPPEPPEEPLPAPPTKRWQGQDRYQALANESEAIQVALRRLSPEIEKARREYSKQVVEQRIDDYSALVEHAVDAARSLGDAILEIYTFLDLQRAEGVELRHFRTVNLTDFGDLNAGSPLYELIVRSFEQKHVGAGKLPRWKAPDRFSLLN
ncbi:hypothetical protein HAP47_0021775 [Bradyrhizobium sp. 41S5]|uniref:hypothetical protein n=1 Tax=Bradyrhizobium sp. 41S5 TaxID=1404443 RepID=UPI00156AC9C2|nr:hypothetical protein [Bradyrhizobium sp. 41S5]UFX41929.1 hypothetical protein HAP47_0021775 [Bradyrhizobium sp. 41S5]